MKWRPSVVTADLIESHINVREDSDKLFEIVPKLCIEPNIDESEHGGGDLLKETQVPSETRVHAAATAGHECNLGIAMGSDFLILNSALDQVKHTMEFEATIDFVIWRRSILLIGLCSSRIILMNPDTLQVLESRNICKMEKAAKRFYVDAFIHSNPDPTKLDLLTIGVDGVVYSFVDVSLSTGSLDSKGLDTSVDIDVATIKGSACKVLPHGVQVTTACSPGREFMVTYDKEKNLSMFSFLSDGGHTNNGCFWSAPLLDIMGIEDPNVSVIKIERYDGLLFVLFSNGRLEFFLDESFFFVGNLKLPSQKHAVQDFQIVIMNANIIKLWVLFSQTEENSHFIGIAASPLFELEFTVRIPSTFNSNVSPNFKFPSSSSVFEEPSVLIEIGKDGTTKFYRMEEFSTDISLQNLLLKGKFDKAELLAQRYDKNMDLVWKAKVTSRFSQLQASKDEAEIESLFTEITRILAQIQDPEFVCTFVVESSVPRLGWVKQLHEIGMKRVGEYSGSTFGKRLLNIVKKFYTFQQVVPGESVERWNEFNSPNTSMFLQCYEFLQKLQFTECEIIWLRHCYEFLPEMVLSSFGQFFRKLFMHRLDSEAGVSLFKTIFPFALEKCERNESDDSESRVSALVSLIISQIRNLEREPAWPTEGIAFLELLLKAVEEEETKLQEHNDLNESRLLERAAICSDILERLRTILQALYDLKQLFTSHRIRILFDKYLNDSKPDVINSMFSCIWGKDEVEFFLKDFLVPFAKRQGLSVDEIIEQHIEFTANEVAYYMRADSIPFEERIVTVIDYISSPAVRIRCVHVLSKSWPVPWHPPMEDIVVRALRLNVQGDPESTLLQKSIQLIQTQVPYRCILQKYSLSASKFTHGFNVVHTIKRILKTKKPGCFEDCLELIKHTGKCDAEGVRKIKFWYELSESTLPVEDIIPGGISPELIQRFLNRILEQFRQAPDLFNRDSEPWDRYTACARLLANRVQDNKAIQFFQLREIVNNLWSTDELYSTKYPFSVLQIILDANREQPGPYIIDLCHRLSRISFSPVKDILLTAGGFFCNDGLRGSELTKIWEIVTEIVRLPGNFHSDGEIVPCEGLTIALQLAQFIPSTTNENLDILEDFYRMIFASFESEPKIIESLVKIMAILSIFRELRDKEIPLETEFLDIYLEVWIQRRKGVTSLLPQLKSFGESLLRFGDTELFGRIFVAMYLEYLNQASNTFGKRGKELEEGALELESLRRSLLENVDEYQVEEKNTRVINLVKSLQAAGLQLNAYALHQRNKARLIRKLIEMNKYPLASQTALVFDFRDGPSWSLILREYICQGTISELKNLLEALKKISDLWVVPEFKEAWIKVSEKYPNFRHICPIPLLD